MLFVFGANAPTISDTFATHYSWTRVGIGISQPVQVWVGTGGSGTSGVLTVVDSGTGLAYGTYSTNVCSFTGADNTASGLAVLDAYGVSNSSTCAVITPTAPGECLYLVEASQYGVSTTSGSSTPTVWSIIDGYDLILGYYGTAVGGASNPPVGVATNCAWGGFTGITSTIIALIKASPYTTNPIVMIIG